MGNNEYWPVNRSIGNIHNNIHWAHDNGLVLLGFLPTPTSKWYLLYLIHLLRSYEVHQWCEVLSLLASTIPHHTCSNSWWSQRIDDHSSGHPVPRWPLLLSYLYFWPIHWGLYRAGIASQHCPDVVPKVSHYSLPEHNYSCYMLPTSSLPLAPSMLVTH